VVPNSTAPHSRFPAAGQREGALALGSIGEEPAGLPAYPPLGLHGPMVAVGKGSTSIWRWVDRLQPVAQTCGSLTP